MRRWLGRLRRELRRIRSQLRKLRIGARLGGRWRGDEDALSRRVYPSYRDYLDHQRLKLDALRATSLERHDRRFAAALLARLRASPIPLEGRSVLCLAARTGAEVRAFRETGASAIGIDLNPGPDNPWVIEGDFHDLRFGDGSFDVVYVNSLDHAYDLDRVLAEVARVLVDRGLLWAELGMGSEEGNPPGFYEALSWPSVDALVERIERAGFVDEGRRTFDAPWRGVRVLLRRS